MSESTMTTVYLTAAELTSEAIRVLCRELGPVNTARFLRQFGAISGDYTRDRDSILGDPTVDELAAEILRLRERLDR